MHSKLSTLGCWPQGLGVIRIAAEAIPLMVGVGGLRDFSGEALVADMMKGVQQPEGTDSA